MVKSSKQWLADHFADTYVKRAQKEGYRSRAAYKLLDLNERDQLIKPGMVVVDLGAAPGGWSQVAVKLVGKHGQVFALDILPMEEVPGVQFILGDFRELETLEKLLIALDNRPVDIIISDMAPNLSGMSGIDQPRAMYLAELALELLNKVLKPGGSLVMKLFQGEGFEVFLKDLRKYFNKVLIRKPPASKAKSAEVYLVCKDFRGSFSGNQRE